MEMLEAKKKKSRRCSGDKKRLEQQLTKSRERENLGRKKIAHEMWQDASGATLYGKCLNFFFKLAHRQFFIVSPPSSTDLLAVNMYHVMPIRSDDHHNITYRFVTPFPFPIPPYTEETFELQRSLFIVFSLAIEFFHDLLCQLVDSLSLNMSGMWLITANTLMCWPQQKFNILRWWVMSENLNCPPCKLLNFQQQ